MEEVFSGLIRTKEASQRVGIHQDHIRRLLEHGKIKGVKVGRDWVVDTESVDQYAATRGWYKARRRKKRKMNK